jgi:hypothetical protein
MASRILSYINPKLIVACAATLLIFGCTRSVEVLTQFPEPVMEAFPLVMGIRYPTELTDFTHNEDPELAPEWTIKLGKANLRMFRALFTGMFIQTVELNNAANESADKENTAEELTTASLDAIIEPSLEEVEFSVPEQSGNDQFTIWLRYNIRITTPEGELITDWRITGYGQEDEGSMGMGDETAMREAAITALRDVAANIATNFGSAPNVKRTLLKPPNPFMEGTGIIATP